MKSSNFICTIGPTNNSPERIERMIYKGMSVARLNVSHGKLEEHSMTIESIRSAALRCQERTGYYCPLGIAVDLRGPEVRTGAIEAPGKVVNVGDNVRFNDNPAFAEKSSSEIIHIDYPIASFLKRQYKIYIDDGSVELKVEDIFGDNIACEVTKAGTLSSNQVIFVPDIVKFLNLPARISDQDLLGIEFAVENDVDFIFASHVECGNWIKEIRSLLGDSEDNIKVFAKIQNRFGVDEAEEIVKAADGIIFQPTIDIDAKIVPFIQRLLLKLCKKEAKPCFSVLESLELNPEMYQIVNWLLDAGDGAIVSREAAKGKSKPLQTMKTLKSIQTVVSAAVAMDSTTNCDHTDVIQGSLAAVCVMSSINTNSSAIIIMTTTCDVHIVHLVYNHRPTCEIIAVTEDSQSARQLNILDRVTPLFYKNLLKNLDRQSKLDFAIDFARNRGIIKRGDTIVVLKADEGLMEIHYVSYNNSTSL